MCCLYLLVVYTSCMDYLYVLVVGSNTSHTMCKRSTSCMRIILVVCTGCMMYGQVVGNCCMY